MSEPPISRRASGSDPASRRKDAQGDLELGQVIEWFDEFVGNERTTYFEAR
jgi:hypothetical protein